MNIGIVSTWFERGAAYVSRQMEKSLAKNLAGTVKSVLGSCLSVGCTVDKLNPKQVIAKINNGELKI